MRRRTEMTEYDYRRLGALFAFILMAAIIMGAMTWQ